MGVSDCYQILKAILRKGQKDENTYGNGSYTWGHVWELLTMKEMAPIYLEKPGLSQLLLLS